MFCRRRLSCRDRDPLNRSRARPALQRKPYRSFPESPRSARCAPFFPIQRGSKFRLRRWIYKFRRRSEEHTSELQSRRDLVCRLLLEKKKQKIIKYYTTKQVHASKVIHYFARH